ncbi:hypothetical protein V1498_13160 [Peribacillus sp. SCS-26]|uniref:hypothetical protein n=1 Tax=Paraperibacillus marinus TaxID=3115295 RepID=UPI003905A7D6
MSKESQEWYLDALRRMETQKENEVNRKIKDFLNQRDLIQRAHEENYSFSKYAREFKESMETMSALGNFPTKRDIANIAKMQVQMEEKIDHIEDILTNLSERFEKERKSRKKSKKRKKAKESRSEVITFIRRPKRKEA